MNHIEKSIQEQIVEKMISKLEKDENIDKKMLDKLKSIELSKKSEVKEIISEVNKATDNENTKA